MKNIIYEKATRHTFCNGYNAGDSSMFNNFNTIKMRIDALITLVALIGMIITIVYIIQLGRRDAEYIFESDYYNLQQFIHECPITTENKIKIHKRFLEMEKMKGFNLEKMQVLWGEYKFHFNLE